jgi:glycosyltransferase involved in cell wall biosynthesis
MRILQLCKKFPFPPKDGESIAVTGLSRALHHAGAEITLLAMNTSKHFVEITHTPHELEHYKEIHSISVDNKLRILDAFLNLFSDDSYHVSRFVSAAFERKLIHLLKEEDFDVVQLETLFLAPYIPVIRKYSRAAISMRAHNVEHEIWERITGNTKFPLKKFYLDYLAKKLRKFEINNLSHYDFLAAITQKDLDKFRSLGFNNSGKVIPIGVDPSDYKPDFSSYRKELSIAFIGSLDWQPNVEGIQWFLENVWGKLQKRFTKVKLHIAGRNAPGWLKTARMKNMIFIGEVPDAPTFINQHSIVVVPLRSGSGMRAKILEAMALGKVVITTSIGLEGIPAKHRREVLIADNAQQFLEALAFCQQQNGRLEQMGRKAMDFVNRRFETKEIGKQLMEAYSNLMVEAVKV